MSSIYTRYYLSQCGRGEIGDVYKPDFFGIQRGRGLGSILGGLIRVLRPLFVKGLNAVKNQALKTGSEILMDIGTKPFKQILVDRGREAQNNLKGKAVQKLKNMSGDGIYTGSNLGSFIPTSSSHVKTSQEKKSGVLSKILSKVTKTKRKGNKKVKRKISVKQDKKKKKKNNSRTLDIFS